MDLEQFPSKEKVTGSSPVESTLIKLSFHKKGLQMVQVTSTTTYCDNCDKVIENNYPKVKISPTVITNLVGVFNYTIGTGEYTFINEDFCSEKCFVENIAKKLGVKIEVKE